MNAPLIARIHILYRYLLLILASTAEGTSFEMEIKIEYAGNAIFA